MSISITTPSADIGDAESVHDPSNHRATYGGQRFKCESARRLQRAHGPIMRESIARRAFVERTCALLAAALELPRVSWSRAAPASSPVLRVGVTAGERLAGSDVEQLTMGARLGAEEATHSAMLFGGSGVELVATASRANSARGLSAMIGGGSADECIAIGEAAAENGLLFMNTLCADDSLRTQRCRPTTFHVAPSVAMLHDALAEVRHDETRLPAGVDDLEAVAWDASLDRFGADTLNNRFRERFDAPMSWMAWCAWVAVKILGEASLRSRSTDSRAIADYLRRDRTQFDGHKGRPLSFRPWDNQLRQPLYVVARGKDRVSRVVAEAPVAGPTDVPSRELLDRLGITRGRTVCRMTE